MHVRRSLAAALSAALLLATAACGGDDDNTEESQGSPAVSTAPEATGSPEPTESAKPTASPSPEAVEGTTVTIDLVKGKPSKLLEDVKVAKGERLTLKATSDEPHEIHVHGYDKVLDVKPGSVERVTFKANQTGSFLVEVEDTGKELFSIQVK